MSNDSAFNKRLTEETTMDKVEGLLDHLNLPPKVIDFIRVNQRVLQVLIAVIVIAVVAWSLYGSYRERIVEEGASALSLAMKTDIGSRAEALQKVADQYSNTTSATWAKVELAHLDMKNGAYSDAADKYAAVVGSIKDSNPLYPLTLFGAAQALEAGGKYQEAAVQYNLLKDINGYSQLSYTGLARIEEMQGNFDKAIATYNNFLLLVGDDPTMAQARTEIEEKIARLKARQ